MYVTSVSTSAKSKPILNILLFSFWERFIFSVVKYIVLKGNYKRFLVLWDSHVCCRFLCLLHAWNESMLQQEQIFIFPFYQSKGQLFHQKRHLFSFILKILILSFTPSGRQDHSLAHFFLTKVLSFTSNIPLYSHVQKLWC